MIFTVIYETDINIQGLAQDIYEECAFNEIEINVPLMVNEYLNCFYYYVGGWDKLSNEQKQPVFDAVKKAIEDIKAKGE